MVQKHSKGFEKQFNLVVRSATLRHVSHEEGGWSCFSAAVETFLLFTLMNMYQARYARETDLTFEACRGGELG